jgi:hypothetical protein
MKIPALAALVLSLASVSLCHAQPYPAKNVRIIVGLAPGGTTDVFTRTLAQRLTEAWGQTVIVENRPGASGMIGAEVVAKAAPDGYTLLCLPQTSLAVAPGALRQGAVRHRRRTSRRFSLLGSTPLVMIVHPSFAAKTFAEFRRARQERERPLAYGSGGVGSSPHMTGELIGAALGVQDEPCSLQGREPGDRRHHRRPDPDHVRQPAGRPAARALRQRCIALADHHRQALAARARDTDHERGRHPGFRNGDLVRHARAGGDSAGAGGQDPA